MVVLVSGLSLVGCNPLSAWDECASRPGPTISPGQIVDGVDVYAEIAKYLRDNHGTLTWLRSGAQSDFSVLVERDESAPVTGSTDCKRAPDGYIVPLKISVRSADGLVSDGRGGFHMKLDLHGVPIGLGVTRFSLDYDTLKAGGVTPSELPYSYLVYLDIPWRTPAVTPVDTRIDVLDGDGKGNVRYYQIASIDFP